MKLKIMTYNIASGNDFSNHAPENPKRDDIVLNPLAAAGVMKKYGADIIGVNEVHGKSNPEYFPEEAEVLGKALGYNYYFGQAKMFANGPYGNALLSRFPIVSAEVIPIPDPEVKDEDTYYETRAIIRAKIDVPVFGILTVMVSHFGLATSEKRNAAKTLVSLLEDTPDPLIFMGDLNMTPACPILQEYVFPRLNDTAAILPETPLTDVWWAPKRKIDYIFTRGNVKTLSAQAPDEHVSDHRPYLAEIEL